MSRIANTMFYGGCLAATGASYMSGEQNENEERKKSALIYASCHAVGFLGGLSINRKARAITGIGSHVGKAVGLGFSVFAIGGDHGYAKKHSGQKRHVTLEITKNICQVLGGGPELISMISGKGFKIGRVPAAVVFEIAAALCIVGDGLINRDKAMTWCGGFSLVAAVFADKLSSLK